MACVVRLGNTVHPGAADVGGARQVLPHSVTYAIYVRCGQSRQSTPRLTPYVFFFCFWNRHSRIGAREDRSIHPSIRPVRENFFVRCVGLWFGLLWEKGQGIERRLTDERACCCCCCCRESSVPIELCLEIGGVGSHSLGLHCKFFMLRRRDSSFKRPIRRNGGQPCQ